MYNDINKREPERIHECPLHRDDLKAYNVLSLQKHDFEKIMPEGDYRYEHKVFADDDDNIFTKTVFERYKTGEKSFF